MIPAGIDLSLFQIPLQFFRCKEVEDAKAGGLHQSICTLFGDLPDSLEDVVKVWLRDSASSREGPNSPFSVSHPALQQSDETASQQDESHVVFPREICRSILDEISLNFYNSVEIIEAPITQVTFNIINVVSSHTTRGNWRLSELIFESELTFFY